MAPTRPVSQNLRVPVVVLFAVCLVIAASIATVAQPVKAFADYSISKVSISAQVETDGSLHVVEQRTFEFDEGTSSIQWSLGGLPSNTGVEINSVRMAPVGSDGQMAGYPQVLKSVPFVLQWRDSGGPGSDSYSYDRTWNNVHVFFGTEGGGRLIELDYTVENGVTAYADVGEVSWRFVGDSWAVASENVTMSLALPLPSRAAVNPGDNVRAWGHGPSDGTVEINEDGSIVYTIPNVGEGEYAEAHVVFPSDWLVNLPSGDAQPHRTEMRLSSVLSEEAAWVDQASRSRMLSLALIAGCALLCAAALGVGLWAYFRHGREYEPRFKDDYWNDEPERGTHPAVIGRLWRWGRRSDDDFVATAMHLDAIGALDIRLGERPQADAGNPDEDYLLTRVPDVGVSDPLDRQALELMFGKIAGGAGALWFSQIGEFGKKHPQEFVDAMDAWQSLLSEKTNARSFFEKKGKQWKIRLFVLAGVVVLAAIAAWTIAGTAVPFAFALASGAGLLFLGARCERRTKEGNEICAKCKALRNWLCDLPESKEALPVRKESIGALSPYAFLFGAMDAALAVPNDRLREGSVAFDNEARGRRSWALWCMPREDATSSLRKSAAEVMLVAFDKALNDAHKALSAGGAASDAQGNEGSSIGERAR